VHKDLCNRILSGKCGSAGKIFAQMKASPFLNRSPLCGLADQGERLIIKEANVLEGASHRSRNGDQWDNRTPRASSEYARHVGDLEEEARGAPRD